MPPDCGLIQGDKETCASEIESVVNKGESR